MLDEMDAMLDEIVDRLVRARLALTSQSPPPPVRAISIVQPELEVTYAFVFSSRTQLSSSSSPLEPAFSCFSSTVLQKNKEDNYGTD